jgi:hypothetical protein
MAGVRWSIVASALLLASCASETPRLPFAASPEESRALIERLLPATAPDRAAWVSAVYDGFSAHSIQPSAEKVCAVVAVIEQESNFRVNPVVPRLGAVALREIDSRADRAGLPRILVRAALSLNSSTGVTYEQRIRAARTEKDLSDVYEDFIGRVPLGRTLFESRNPVRTRGPMQVNVAFAADYSRTNTYPYPVKGSIADELFTRRGSVYFGIAHLLDYRAPYDSYLYRFADFNAGQYASRNAAFQKAVARASGIAVVADGALLPHDADGKEPGNTELAARALAKRLKLSESDIHSDLQQGRREDFAHTELYERVFALTDRAKNPLPRAAVPRIVLQGPKITRTLTTDWYAHRVDERFKQCLRAR